MEEQDNPQLFNKSLNAKDLNVTYNPVKLGGISEIVAKDGNKLWNLIPYYTWSNRGVGKMKVWIESNPLTPATTQRMGWD